VTAVRAGVAYFAVVFAAGFALGAARVMLVVPRLSETAAVALEVPLMLVLSWIACRWVVRRFNVSPAASARLIMGGAAFALLMAGEVGVSVLGFGRTFAEHFAAYGAPGALIGLAGQIAFALMPLVQASRAKREV